MAPEPFIEARNTRKISLQSSKGILGGDRKDEKLRMKSYRHAAYDATVTIRALP